MSRGCGGCGCGSREQCTCACDCHQLTPPVNRPGLQAIAARLGDYHEFFGDAVSQLSDADRPELRDLGTRELADPAMAWLDAWSVAADVLTFYRERLTNDGYLRTARDERALRELAALVGYKPRPGVAATAHLAYLMEKTAAPVSIPLHAKAQTVPGPGEQMLTFETDEPFAAHAEWSQMVPRLTRPAGITIVDALVRSSLRLASTAVLVRPGERMLFVFGHKVAEQVVREVLSSTVDILAGYTELELKPRITLTSRAPKVLAEQLIALRADLIAAVDREPFKSLLAITASFLLGGSARDSKILAHVVREAAGDAADQALAEKAAKLFERLEGNPSGFPVHEDMVFSSADFVLAEAASPQTQQLASPSDLPVAAGDALSMHGPDRMALLLQTSPELSDTLPAVMNSLPVSPAGQDNSPKVYLLRATANGFATFAPPNFLPGHTEPTEHTLDNSDAVYDFLDTVYDGIQPASYVVRDFPADLSTVARPGDGQILTRSERLLAFSTVTGAVTVTRHAYGMSNKSTRLELTPLGRPTFGPASSSLTSDGPGTIARLRARLYHVQSEEVVLAGDVVDEPIRGDRIQLQARIDHLQPGQWVIVTGERVDILDANKRPVPGVRGGELAMIMSVDHDADQDAPGDTLHTFLTLQTSLAYRYRRSTAVVYGNVVKSSHGETVTEMLGSGEASRAGQRFGFARGPLTFTTAPTPDGAESAETVRVNGLRYQRVDSLLDAGPATPAYTLDVDGAGLGMLTFGDGANGARLPTGSQNVRTEYRVGLGAAGNVRGEQISLLTTRPLGVSAVVNPLRASGGADRDSAERIRQNVPIATRGLSRLSRLVSIEDYANFARRFAGIGLAEAARLTDGAQQFVYVTVAGVDDNSLDAGGELLTNLLAAYVEYGDPALPVEIGVRELKMLLIEARIAVVPAASWELVEPQVRKRLLAAFGFERRRLGQSAYLSEAVRVMQNTPGVDWVDVDKFGAFTESQIRNADELKKAMTKMTVNVVVAASRARANSLWKPLTDLPRFTPAELVLLPDVRGIVALNQA